MYKTIELRYSCEESSIINAATVGPVHQAIQAVLGPTGTQAIQAVLGPTGTQASKGRFLATLPTGTQAIHPEVNGTAGALQLYRSSMVL